VRNISDKICRENKKKIHVQIYIFFLNCASYEIMWKNMVQPDSRQMTIGRIRIACWITKATHSDYIIYIAFPHRQWLEESASMLRYTNIASIAIFISYQGAKLLVLIHSFDSPVNKHVYPSLAIMWRHMALG
jgi:hypothetical protein